MSFSPYINYKVALPDLAPGNLIKIKDTYYMVITVRENRKTVTITGSQTKLPLALDGAASYENLAGNMNKNRLVHIQYVAIDQANTPELFWGTEPLQSKDVDDTMSTVTAGISNPMQVNRWSYDQAMRMLVSQSATQDYYFLIKEYEIIAYAGTPNRPYTQIMANGQAIRVEDAATATAIAGMTTAKPSS